MDADRAAEPFEDPAARDLTERAARESMTLLQNERDLLPFDPEAVDVVAAVGPKTDDPQELMGDYAYPAHYPEAEVDLDATTPLDALRERGDEHGFEVRHVRGCTTTGPETDEFEAAADALADADVAVAFVGARSAVDFSESDRDRVDKPSVSTSGEGRDVVDLGLPDVQGELIDRVNGADTPPRGRGRERQAPLDRGRRGGRARDRSGVAPG